RINNITQILIDPSCPICYLGNIIPDTHRFLNFWDWLSSEYPVISYTSNTKHQLNRLISCTLPEAILERIELLVLSIRYNRSSSCIISLRLLKELDMEIDRPSKTIMINVNGERQRPIGM
ncbi:11947_t:CDS:2, partial [Funneliformis geosporum]